MTMAAVALLLAPVMAEETKPSAVPAAAPAVSAPAKTESATLAKPAKKVMIKKAKRNMKKM